LYLFIVIILYHTGKDKLEDVAKIALYGFLLILTVPLLDGFIFGSGVISYNYDFSNFIYSFINLFNIRANIDFVTNGVRVEIALVMSISFLYLQYFSLSRAFIGSFLIYSVVFIYGYLPAFYGLDMIIENSVLVPHNLILWHLYIYVPLVVILFFYFLFKFKDIFLSFIRVERLFIYIGLFLFGVFYTAKNSIIDYDFLNIFDIYKILLAILSLSFAFFYSVIINDVVDIKIDKISNKNRALPQKLIKLKDYNALGYIFLTLGLCFGFGVNLVFFFLLFFIIALSYIYSVKPLRLKQYFIISNIVLSTIGTSVFLLGVSMLEQTNIVEVSKPILSLIFIAFFIASFLKDYKDKVSDKKDGVKTIANIYENSFIYLKLFIMLFYTYMSYKLIGFNIILQSLILGVIFFKKSEKLLLYIQGIVALIYVSYVM
jgi:4-hydroxybenzoate polyprenyltransferase